MSKVYSKEELEAMSSIYSKEELEALLRRALREMVDQARLNPARSITSDSAEDNVRQRLEGASALLQQWGNWEERDDPEELERAFNSRIFFLITDSRACGVRTRRVGWSGLRRVHPMSKAKLLEFNAVELSHLLNLLNDAEERGEWYGGKTKYWTRHHRIKGKLEFYLRNQNEGDV